MKIFILSLLFSTLLRAQIIEGISTLGLNQFSHTTLKMSGFGNRGFDDYNGIYNPKYDLNDSTFKISISGLLNSQINRNIKTNSGTIEYLKNKIILLPEFGIKYKLDKVQFSLQYFNSILSYQKFGDKSGTTTLNIGTQKGYYRVQVSKDANFKTTEKKIQFTISYLAYANTSLSLGILTNCFEHIYDWIPLDPMSFNVDFFTNTQFLFSINQKLSNRSSAYLVLETQYTRKPMNKHASFMGEEIILPDSYLYLPGNIGYGYQLSLFNRIKVSAEMSHQFIEINQENRYEYYTEKIEHHIWNNEVLFGINARIIDKVYAGILFSKYLKYDNNIYMRFTSGEGPSEFEDIGPSKPLSIIASIKYSIFNYDLILNFQHSEIEYNPEKYGSQMNDYGNFFKLTLSANISRMGDFIP